MLQDGPSCGNVPCIQGGHHLVYQISQRWARHDIAIHPLGLCKLPDELLQCSPLLQILRVQLIVSQFTELGSLHVGLVQAKSCTVLGNQAQRLPDLVDLHSRGGISACCRSELIYRQNIEENGASCLPVSVIVTKLFVLLVKRVEAEGCAVLGNQT